MAVDADEWTRAEANGQQSQRLIAFCRAYVQGWLAHADRRTGLLPRKVWDPRENYWNARDCAADNYPFITLTGEITGDYYTQLAARHILAQEQKLCNRLGTLPDDFAFSTQQFRYRESNLDRLIFGASEYCKDGLMPITEAIGPSPWLDRMQQLVRDVWANAAIKSPVGPIPTKNVEVNGDLMEVMSRLYWMTGDNSYREWCYRLMDYYSFHDPLLKWSTIPLRDHGCEIIAGMSEVYLVAAQDDRARWEKYRPTMHALLDAILAKGVNEDGLMPGWFNPASGEKASEPLSDGWGYVYNAFLTVAQADGDEHYCQAVEHALVNIHKYRDYRWGSSSDEYADSVEGALNLLNRIPIETGFTWVEAQAEKMLGRQRNDGIIEGWYGDGNSARTLMMVALWKTQGVMPTPWRQDLQLGTFRNDDGSLSISLKAEAPWTGTLRFDRPRHREFFHMPVDYPRINRFPEWFTIEVGETYELQVEGEAITPCKGKSLLNYPISLAAKESVRLTVRPKREQPARTNQRHE